MEIEVAGGLAGVRPWSGVHVKWPDMPGLWPDMPGLPVCPTWHPGMPPLSSFEPVSPPHAHGGASPHADEEEPPHYTKRQRARARAFANQIKITNEQLATVAQAVIARDNAAKRARREGKLGAPACGMSPEKVAEILAHELSLVDQVTLAKWADALRSCSRKLIFQDCKKGHQHTIVCCCQVAPCSRYQRVKSLEWRRRADEVVREHPNEGRGRNAHNWHLLTWGLQHGDHYYPAAHVNPTVKTRAALARFLQKKYGMLGAYAAIEMSAGDHVHCHMLIYSRFVPLDVLRSWLRARDCTIPGCQHIANDRCQACKAAKCSCAHDDNGRRRCNGSWYVDIRKATNPVEALKYAVEPIVPSSSLGKGANMDCQSEAFQATEGVLRFYLAMRGRHRVESYGFCKPGQEADEVTPDEELSEEEQEERKSKAGKCWCGLPLRAHTIAVWEDGRYRYAPWNFKTMGDAGEPPPAWKGKDQVTATCAAWDATIRES